MTNNLNNKYIVIATMVSLLNSFYYHNFYIMLLLVTVESIVLFNCLLHKKYTKYLCYFIIFLSTSLESSNFVGSDVFYGFKNFKIIGVNLGALFLLIIFTVLFIKGSRFKDKIQQGMVKKFSNRALLLTGIALIMGLISVLCNDNNIKYYLTDMMMFIDASYIYVFVALEIIVVVTIIRRDQKATSEIKQSIIAIIIGTAVTLIMSLIFENYGNRGGLASLQVSNLIMLLVCAIVLPFYRDFNSREKLILGISGIVIFILALIYNTNGKMVIIAFLVPIMIILILVKEKKYKLLVFGSIVGILLLMFIINFAYPKITKSSPLFHIKFQQASSMLSFWETDWFENMPDSPKVRIAQFANITNEFYLKPWYIVTGKGYLGTIKDHLGMFNNTDEFAYSFWELSYGLYFTLHETLNSLYLTNGLIGLIFFLSIFRIIISNFAKSPWIMIGGFWFVLFYAYSITISIFGVTVLIIGLYELDKERNALFEHAKD